ncbi:MAG: TAXI family TRAP transporter solute-binding subunit [Pseudomonadota bacterium]
MQKLLKPLLPLLFVTACTTERETTSVALGSGAIGGNYQAAGHAIARAVNENATSQATLLQEQASSGSVANIDALLSGEIAFGIAQADHLYQAVQGQGAWAERGPQAQLRAVFGLYTESVTLLAAADTAIEAIADLKDLKVDIGLPDTGTRQNAIDALTAAGINWESDLEAHAEPLDSRLTRFAHGGLDAFFYTISHPNSTMKFATYTVRGARFVPLANVEALVDASPYYTQTTIPVDLYPQAANSEDVETIGVKALLVTSADVPEELVHRVAEAVFANLRTQQENHEVLGSLSADEVLNGLTAPLHPGARRYFEESGHPVVSSIQ